MSRYQPVNMSRPTGPGKTDPELEAIMKEMSEFADRRRAEQAKRAASPKSSGQVSRSGAAATGGRRSPSPSSGRAAAGAGGGRAPSPSPKRNQNATNIYEYLTPKEIEEMQREIEESKNDPESVLYIKPIPSPAEFARQQLEAEAKADEEAALKQKYPELYKAYSRLSGYKRASKRRMRLRKTDSKRKSKKTRSQYAKKKKLIKKTKKTGKK